MSFLPPSVSRAQRRLSVRCRPGIVTNYGPFDPGSAVHRSARASRCTAAGTRLNECAEAGDGATDDQRIDLARALIGIDGLGIGDETADVMIEQDAIAPEELARPADRLPRPHGAEGLRQRGMLLIHQACIL